MDAPVEQRRHPTRPHGNFAVRAAAAALLLVIVACTGGGCASGGAGSKETALRAGSRSVNADIAQRIRSDVMGFADTHAGRFAQALDEIIANDPPAPVRNFAIQNRVGNLVATVSIAISPNPFVSLLDMVVMVTLKRQSIEERAIPGILAGRGDGLLTALRRSEADAWEMADKYLNKAQLDELREQIRLWKAQNPDYDYVGFARFSEFGSFRQFQQDPAKARPESIFSLLYVDPLAKLDPVAQEMHGYRSLSERLTFLSTRLPLIAGLEARSVIWQATNDTPFTKFVDSCERFASATERFANAASKYPADLSKERDAAVKQIAEEFTTQRKAVTEEFTAQRKGIVDDLEKREAGIRNVLADARGVVESTQTAASSIRTTADGAVNNAVDTSEAAARRTLDHAFRLALVLLLAGLVGVPLAALAYRACARRVGRSHGGGDATGPAGTMRIA